MSILATAAASSLAHSTGLTLGSGHTPQPDPPAPKSRGRGRRLADTLLLIAFTLVLCFGLFKAGAWALAADKADAARSAAGQKLTQQLCGDSKRLSAWAKERTSKFGQADTYLGCQGGAVVGGVELEDGNQAATGEVKAKLAAQACKGQPAKVVYVNDTTFKWKKKLYVLVACGDSAATTKTLPASSTSNGIR